jgi:hypothetical protein
MAWPNPDDPTGQGTQPGDTTASDDTGGSGTDPIEEMIARDRGAWEGMLQSAAAARNLAYDPSDLEDVIRWVRSHPGQDPIGGINVVIAKYDARAKSGGAGGGGGTIGVPGYVPPRYTFTPPERPPDYTSTYSPQFLQAQSPVGEAERNRLMLSILNAPETMGETQQAQLFEQQKELLAAQRQQQEARLSQTLTARGLSRLGGTALAGDLLAGQDFSTQLLQAQRDIATKAAQQNRADQLAALQMQDAMAQGDAQRMMAIYEANQRERTNTENFLRQAAELRQQSLLQSNAQRLAAEGAQAEEWLNFYNFLEKQRQFQQLLTAPK